MAGANYFHYPRTGVTNQKPGYVNKGLIAPKSWLTTIAEPPVAPVNPEDAYIVTEDHEFTTGKGFVECYALPDTVEADGEVSGDPGAGIIQWKPKLFIPGDTAKLQAMMIQIMNDDLLLLFVDANCPGNPVLQFGCDCDSVVRSEMKFTSGNTKPDGRKGWELTLKSNCRFFYQGTIVKMP